MPGLINYARNVKNVTDDPAFQAALAQNPSPGPDYELDMGAWSQDGQIVWKRKDFLSRHGGKLAALPLAFAGAGALGALGGGAGSAATGAAGATTGGNVLGAIKGAGSWLGKNAPTILGAIGTYQGIRDNQRSQEYQEKALRMAEEREKQLAPIRNDVLGKYMQIGSRERPQLGGIFAGSPNPFSRPQMTSVGQR